MTILTRKKALTDLGLYDRATDEEIKKSYRSLSARYHPDKKGGDEEKFKTISVAYDFLTSPQKPARPEFAFNSDDFMSQMFRAANGASRDYQQTREFTSSISVTMKEAFMGAKKSLAINILGGKVFEINVPPGLVPNARLKTIEEKDQHGNTIIISLYLQIVVDDLKVTWADEPYLYGGATEGSGNIEMPFQVSWLNIMFGGQEIVETIDGKHQSIYIPAGIASGTRLKAKGLGYWKDTHTRSRGDVLLRVIPVIPKATDMSSADMDTFLAKMGDLFPKKEEEEKEV